MYRRNMVVILHWSSQKRHAMWIAAGDRFGKVHPFHMLHLQVVSQDIRVAIAEPPCSGILCLITQALRAL